MRGTFLAFHFICSWQIYEVRLPAPPPPRLTYVRGERGVVGEPGCDLTEVARGARPRHALNPSSADHAVCKMGSGYLFLPLSLFRTALP